MIMSLVNLPLMKSEKAKNPFPDGVSPVATVI